jgi:predicted dehydrogenase
MFLRENLDIADIATTMETHVEIAIAAARNGLHVLCQKPFARNIDEAKAIIKECKTAGVKLMVHQNFRFQPFPQYLKKMMNDTVLGNVFYCRIFHRLPYCEVTPAGRIPFLDFQHSWANEEKLVLLHMVIHHLDTARFLLGEPLNLYAITRRIGTTTRGENIVSILLEYDKAICYIEESWVTRGQTSIGFRLEGDKGTVQICNEQFCFCEVDGSRHEFSLSSLYPDVTMDTIDQYSFKMVQREFVDCILDDKVPSTNGEDNLKTLELVDKAYQSANNHQAVRLRKSNM